MYFALSGETSPLVEQLQEFLLPSSQQQQQQREEDPLRMLAFMDDVVAVDVDEVE